MNRISSQEVKHIAELARLGLEESEIEKMKKELTSILNYIDQLKEVDIREVKIERKGVFNQTRKDEISSYSRVDKLLSPFPDRKNRYLKVKSVFKKRNGKRYK